MDISDKLTNLKNQLLDLAIRGKLVEQRPEEGTAEELYSHIQEEKKKLIAEKKIKKENPLPEIKDEEIPFEIPESWKWVYIGNIIELVSGRDLTLHDISSVPSGIPYLTGASQITPEEIIINRWTTNPVVISQLNDILLTCKGTVGKNIINNIGEIHIARQIMALRNRSVCIHNKYLKLFLEDVVSYLISKANGLIPGISREDILYLKFPLPPLAEQKRIVAKLESYLAVIDKAEALIDKKANLDEEIRNKILDLAIRGKLVEQRPEDGTAVELYAQIKKDKPLSEIKDEEIPFEIPESWKWVRIGNIISIARGASPRPIKAFITEDINGINWIKIGDTTEGDKYINSSKEKITQEGSLKSRVVHSGDFLLTNSMSFGHPYILNIDGCVHDGWLILSDYSSCYDKLFLYYLLSSSFAYIQFSEAASGTTVKNLNSDKVSSSIFPLPPLAEQKRIVAKIEELLPYCEKLK